MIQFSMQDKNGSIIQLVTDGEHSEENLTLVRNQVSALYSEQQHIAMGVALEARELNASMKRLTTNDLTVETLLADANAVVIKPGNETPSE